MASLNEAYRRVREQTESNNSARDEGQGVFQEVFQGILGDLNSDLDKNNIDKPLSPIGSALDSVLGFREKHIKDAAKNSARLEQAQYTAGAPLRADTNAEKLKQSLTDAAAENEFTTNQYIAGITHGMPSGQGGIDVGSHIRTIVANDASLAPAIQAAHKRGDLFRVFPKGYVGQVKDGTLLHTDEDGNQLFATGDSKVKNINKHQDRLTKKFRDAATLAGVTEAQLRDTSIEGRAKLFQSSGFKTAMDQVMTDLSPEMLAGHELYRQELDSRFKEINTKLQRDTAFYMARGSRLQTEASALARQLESPPMGSDPKVIEESYNAKIKEMGENAKLTTKLQLNGNFQLNVQSTVFRRAYAYSLLTGTSSTSVQAKQNIDRALQSTRNDPALKDYARQIRAYYEGDSGGNSGAGAAAPAAPAGNGGKDSETTSKAQRLKQSGKPAKPKGS
jgi:hypothetical protein